MIVIASNDRLRDFFLSNSPVLIPWSLLPTPPKKEFSLNNSCMYQQFSWASSLRSWWFSRLLDSSRPARRKDSLDGNVMSRAVKGVHTSLEREAVSWLETRIACPANVRDLVMGRGLLNQRYLKITISTKSAPIFYPPPREWSKKKKKMSATYLSDLVNSSPTRSCRRLGK